MEIFAKLYQYCLHNFNYLVGIGTLLAFVAIIYQIWQNRKDVRISRTISLLSRYYKDIKILDNLLAPDLFESNNKENRTKMDSYRRYYQIKLAFLGELASYWKRDLIDKTLVKEHLNMEISVQDLVNTINEQNNEIKKDYEYQKIINDIRDMNNDMQSEVLAELRITDLLIKMNIRDKRPSLLSTTSTTKQ